MATRLPNVASQHVDDGTEVTIVHIPNIPHSKSAFPSRQTWSKLLPNLITSNAKVLQFDHGLTIEDPFSWSQLLDQGVVLLSLLFQRQDFQTDTIHPIVFITEGLGGLILKNALVTANRQPKRYKILLESVVGLVLIGVPHIRGTGNDTLERLVTLLRPGLSKVSKKSLSRDQISRLELLSDSFREIDLSLPEGLVSGYETLGTSLASGALSVRKKIVVLVGKEFARIEWPKNLEQLLPIDVKLELVLNPDQDSKFRRDLADYLSKVSTAATTIIERARVEREATASQIPIRPSVLTQSSPLSGRPDKSPSQSYLSVTMSHRRSPPSDSSSPPQTVPSMLGTSSKSDSSFDIIPEATRFDSPTRKPTFPCHLIKPHTRNKRFWPRDEALSAIEDALLPRSLQPQSESPTPESSQLQSKYPTLRTFVLHGMGGVGKTEIATEFVFKHKERFDAIFFLHADDRGRLSSELAKIADVLKLTDSIDTDGAKDAVRDWLANPVKTISNLDLRRTSGSFRSNRDDDQDEPEFAQWLIVFDNADDPEILLEFWPEDGHGSVLVTSRDPMARDDFYFGEQGLELDRLSVDDGAAFLRSMTGNDKLPGMEEVSKTIAARLDGLPLAIEQISAIVRRNALSLAGFLNIYKNDEDFEALHDQRIAKNRGYEYSLAGVWALRDLTAESLALLNVISFLDPDRIQTRMLRENLDVIDLVSFPKSETAFTTALTRLVQGSIVLRGQDSTELRIHRLVQDVARARMRSMKILESTFDVVVELLWTDFPRITRGGVGRAQKIDRWGRCAELFPHVSRLKDFYAKYTGDKTMFKSKAKFADLLNEAGWYQHERTNPYDTTPVVELAQQICEESEEDHSEQLALIFGTRTWSCALMKEPENVFNYATQRLELEQKMFEQTGKITANLAAAYNDKAAAYSMNGLSSKAFPLLEESQRLREAMPSFKPEHNFSPMHERSLAYWHQGEYDKAIDCLLKALRDRIAALGENDRQSVRTGHLFYALGNVKAAQGQLNPALLAESAKWHQKALVHYRATAGDNHYRTASACFRVAEHCIREGQYDIARDLLDQALKTFQDRLYYQQENSRTCYLYHELCMLKGDTEKAKDMLERSVKAFNTAFPQLERTKDDITRDDFVSLCTYDF